MPQFFERRDLFGNSPAIWVLAALLFACPLAWSSIQKIELENDVENWLPPNDPGLSVLRWTHQQFPVDEQIFVSWDDSSLNDPRIGQLIERLEPRRDAAGVPRGGVPYVASLIEPREVLLTMQQNGVPPHEAVRRLEGVILGAGPLRVQLTPAARSRLKKVQADLPVAAAKDLRLTLKVRDPALDLATSAAIPAVQENDATEAPAPATPAVLAATGELLADASIDHDLSITWKGIGVGTPRTKQVVDWLEQVALNVGDGGAPERVIERCFFVPGSPVAVAVALSESGLVDRSEALRVIREATAAVGIAPDQLRLGGSAVAAAQLNHDVVHAAWNTAYPWYEIHRRSVLLTSALVGAALSYVLVRSIRLATIVLFAALLTTFVSVSLVPVTGGTMNMVLVVMPSLLLVVTLSGAIHVANYWKHAAVRNPVTAAVESSRNAFIPCFLAASTTAIGLASLCTSPLSPVRDFGLYASMGTMLSFLAVVYVVPSLLMLWPGKAPPNEELDHPGWRGLGLLLTRRATLQAAVVLLACGIASYGLIHFRSETKVIRYFPETSRVVQDYWFLEGHLAGIVPVETIIRFDQESQAETNFLDRMELVRDVQEQLRRHAEITGCLSLADFQPMAEVPAEDASTLALSRYHRKANTAEERIRSGEIEGVNAFYSLATQTADLRPQSDGVTFQVQAGDELWRITSQVNVMTDADYGTVLREVNELTQSVTSLQPGTHHVVTGTVPLFLRTQQAVLDSLVMSFGLAFALILAIFVVMLRSIPAGLVAMIPNVIPITVVFGLISSAGMRVDIGTMITASIALGMSVDGTLHFLSWFRQKMAAGVNRQEAVISSLMHCGPAIWQTSWAVALGLLVLVPAELLLISRFGWLMAAMIGMALLGDIILLPQLLASPLGELFVAPRTASSAPPMHEPLAGNVPQPHIAKHGVARVTAD